MDYVQDEKINPLSKLGKGDVPGHEFHGNQYTGGGGGSIKISRTTSATDANGRSAGFRGLMLTSRPDGRPTDAKYRGKEYTATGKTGTSAGRRPTHAPAGTPMVEMRTSDDRGREVGRIWVSHGGTHVHED